MVKTCAAYGCKNRFKKRDASGDGITFHRFPHCLERAKKWVNAIRRKDLTITRVVGGNFSVCSEHFVPEDYVPYGARRNLQDFAVPSVFPTHTVKSYLEEVQSMRECAACYCPNNTLVHRQGVTLHDVPKDPALKWQWAVAIRRKAEDGGLWIPYKGSVLCSQHFREEDMDRTGYTARVRLRTGVVPSIFNYDPPPPKDRRISSRRLLTLEELNKILEGPRMEHSYNMQDESSDEREPTPPLSVTHPARPDDHFPRRSVRRRKLVEKVAQAADISGESGKLPELPQSTAIQESSKLPEVPPSLAIRESRSGESDIGMPELPPSPAIQESGKLPEVPPSLAIRESLQLPYGAVTRHLCGMQTKQYRLKTLERTHSSLLDKIEFRRHHPDWRSEKTKGSVPEAPFVTLRHEKSQREPPLKPMPAFSRDTLLPMSPTEAWKTVSALREQVLDLQIALTNSRNQALESELRLQDARADLSRYKAEAKQEVRQAQRGQKNTIRQAEKRCMNCPKLKKRLKEVKKATNKKLCKAEKLNKGLEKVFTPMQLRIFRTGKKPRWVEEDIRRAIELKMYVSHRGYNYVRQTMGIPLPTTFIISYAVRRYESLRPLYDKMLARNLKNTWKAKSQNGGQTPSSKKRMLDDVAMLAGSEPLAENRPVKRRKKLPIAQSNATGQPRHGWPGEAQSRDVYGNTVSLPGVSQRHEVSEEAYQVDPGWSGETLVPVTPQRSHTDMRGVADQATHRWTEDWGIDDEESLDEDALERSTRPRNFPSSAASRPR